MSALASPGLAHVVPLPVHASLCVWLAGMAACLASRQSVQRVTHSPSRLLRAHPFLLVGIGSFLFFVPLLVLDLRPESSLLRGLALLWQSLGVGPHTAANLLSRHAPDIPGWLDGILVVVLGLLPYAAADAILRHLRNRRTRTRASRN
jgi:hypothetical protein